MTEYEAYRSYLCAKIDGNRDPMMLTDSRLRAAYHASVTADFAAWCVAMGYVKAEAPAGEVGADNGTAEVGTPNDAAFVAFTAIAANGGPVKITSNDESVNSSESAGKTVDASKHFKALKKQTEAKQKQG